MASVLMRLRARGLSEIVAALPTAGRIIDLGAGHGTLLRLLLARSPSQGLWAVEHDAARARWLRRHFAGAQVEVLQADMREVPLPPSAGIALIDVLHYFTADAQDRLLRRAAAALAPSGVLVLRDPDPEAGGRFLWNRTHEALATASGFTNARVRAYRTPRAFAAVLEACGLEVETGGPARGLYADRVVIGRRPRAPEASAGAAGE